MGTKSFSKRPFIQTFFLFILLAVFSACDRPMSLKQASQMPPYAGLSSADQQWLYDYHQTDSGALNWLEDEIYLQDAKIRAWRTSDGMFELESLNSHSPKWVIKTKDAIAEVKKSGAPAVAKEYIRLAREKTGGETVLPAIRVVVPGQTADDQRAQKLRTPNEFKMGIISLTQSKIERARKYDEMGASDMAAGIINQVYHMRLNELGADHEATKFAAVLYARYTGSEPPSSTTEAAHPPAPETHQTDPPSQQPPTNATPPTVPKPATNVSPSVNATLDEMISRARQLWDSGQEVEAMKLMSEATDYARQNLGFEHQKTIQVESVAKKMREYMVTQ